jgi:hypothetical protein
MLWCHEDGSSQRSSNLSITLLKIMLPAHTSEVSTQSNQIAPNISTPLRLFAAFVSSCVILPYVGMHPPEQEGSRHQVFLCVFVIFGSMNV